MKQKIAFFGGTGGLGTEVVKNLTNYKVDSINSKKVNLTDENQVYNYFHSNNETDIVVIFSNFNYNSFLHKYKDNDPQLSKQIDVNIKGVSNCISSALKIMRKRQYGRIILASSITVEKNVIGTSIYAACKAYYENLVRTICLENASKNITANCIQLGYMDGGLTYTLPEEFLKETVNNIPMKRLGTPKEIAQTIDFLVNNSYVNGSTIKLTGGL
jgi:NAD(P)-dependent dehydrogenase (short-subunit alcohol dehydrogenase family)